MRLPAETIARARQADILAVAHDLGARLKRIAIKGADMPTRQKPLARMTMPKTKAVYEFDRMGFARILGVDPMPNVCVHMIAELVGVHRASLRMVENYTPARVAAEIDRVRRRVSHGHDGPEAVRTITDPMFGVDVETHERLRDILNDPSLPLDMKVDALEARRREVEALPPQNALYGLRVILAAHALLIWWLFAASHSDSASRWRFVLAILEAAGEGVAGLRDHPERIKHDLGELPRLTERPMGITDRTMPLNRHERRALTREMRGR